MADEEEIVVFGHKMSGYSFRVECALKLKGINYKFVEEDLFNKSPLLLKYNPIHKKIPVLIHKGISIPESSIILEYIDENWKNGYSIWPQDPLDRAQARFWSKFVDDKCMPVLIKVLRRLGGEDEAKELFKILEKELDGKKFFGGDNFGIVDIAVVSFTNWIKLLQEVLVLDLLTGENFPQLSEWTDVFASIGVVKESLPPKDFSLDFIRTRLPTARVDYD